MADVFLSYARESLAWANRVAAGLRAQGFSVWFDDHLPAHRAYSEVIEEQLDASAAVLVLWSEAAARSQWVRSEANRARETGRLVQARLDGFRLPMPFDQIQCADLRGWSGDAVAPEWQRTIESICALAKRQPEASTVNAAPAGSGTVVGRRGLLIGAGAAAATAVGIAGWKLTGTPGSSPEAQLLLQKGLDALQTNDALDPGDPGANLQAIALLTDATRADSRSAKAWGGLAMAYAGRKKAVAKGERAGLDARSRAAAKTALDLDLHEPRALGALLLLDPVYRNWAAAERSARKALQDHPPAPILLFMLSDVLGNTGRWSDAAKVSSRFDRSKFLIPGADRKVVINLWASGDLRGADDALKAAVEDWPQHPQIWRVWLAYLTYSGRPSEALQILREGNERPPQIASDFVTTMRATAEALAGQRLPASAIEAGLAYLKTDPSKALAVAQSCAALGSESAALEIARGYYFGEGEWASLAPAGGDEDRITSPLFEPPMRSLWKHEKFGQLLEKIGLEAFWRRSRTLPDYRRADRSRPL